MNLPPSISGFLSFPMGGALPQRASRDRLGYKGPIRATGKFALDQIIALMLRTGFDEFAVTHPATIARLEAGDLAEVPQYLQPAIGEEQAGGGRAWAGSGCNTSGNFRPGRCQRSYLRLPSQIVIELPAQCPGLSQSLAHALDNGVGYDLIRSSRA
ncbi:MAG: DUF934 domain-containing protein [Nitratireductor sp.]